MSIITFAKEEIKDPDVIANLYDYSAVYGSEWFLKKLGYTKKEFVGSNTAEILGMDKDLQHKIVRETIMKNEGNFNYTVYTKSGKSISFTALMKVVKYNDEHFFIGKVIRDTIKK